MFIIQLSYKVNIQEVDKYLQAHREFLAYYYKQGLLIASGPMKPRTGGIIIAATTDENYIKSIFAKDPYYLAEIADYQFIAFTPVMCCDELTALVRKTETSSC